MGCVSFVDIYSYREVWLMEGIVKENMKAADEDRLPDSVLVAMLRFVPPPFPPLLARYPGTL